MVCSFICAQVKVAQDNQKKARKESARQRQDRRKALDKIKTRADWIKDVDKFYNAYIRLRDQIAELPCPSCGRYDHEIPDSFFGKWDCGHYLSKGSHPELRYEELNTWRQCKSCNGGSGKYAKKNHTVSQTYRSNLIERIGLEKVELLEGLHEPKKYTIDDLKAIKAEYKEKLKALTKRAGAD